MSRAARAPTAKRARGAAEGRYKRGPTPVNAAGDGCGCMRCMCAHARTQARTHITHPSTLLSSASMRDLRERRAPLHRASSRLPRRVSAITNRSRVHAAATYNAQRATYVKTRNTISSPSIPQSTPRRRQRASDRRRGRPGRRFAVGPLRPFSRLSLLRWVRGERVGGRAGSTMLMPQDEGVGAYSASTNGARRS